MQTIAQDNPFAGSISTNRAGSKRMLWAGRVFSGLAVAFLIFDSVGKLLEVQPVILFPTYLALLLWGGLILRDAQLGRFLPWRDRSRS